MPPINTPQLLDLLGSACGDPRLEQFLTAHRIHDRPRTIAQLREEDFVEDDGETDVEYELARAAKESLTVESERLGFCLTFVAAQDYALVHELDPNSKTAPSFMLEQVVFFAKGIQIYQQYLGMLPGGVSFPIRQSDRSYAALGSPLARRTVYDTVCDLFVIDGLVVNFGFGDEAEPMLAHVHVRQQHHFDKIMLTVSPVDVAQAEQPVILGQAELGCAVASAEVQRLFAQLGIEQSDMYQGACPDEITRLTKPEGITLYFDDVPNSITNNDRQAKGQERRLVSMTYKRRGDLSSLGYQGVLPFAFVFGDAPPALVSKAGRAPDAQHSSDQLLSYYWKLGNGLVIHAACSLIDWQLYRVTLHAPFMAAELGV